ncbi:MAG: hypothetical protein JOZ38_04345 [Candidatus Eremiobacteraeota bacterium]|nr:hypothetical protein [Candidatus Eremiobacteraeota bacterium]
MEVQAAGSVAVVPQPPDNTDISAQANAASNAGSPAATGATAPVSPPTPASSSGSVAPAPVGNGNAGANAGHGSGALSPIVAKLFGTPDNPQSVNLNVSYRVIKDLDEIVTVFTDPNTGREIAQFPPQILIGLAEFFAQHQGATLDRSA